MVINYHFIYHIKYTFIWLNIPCPDYHLVLQVWITVIGEPNVCPRANPNYRVTDNRGKFCSLLIMMILRKSHFVYFGVVERKNNALIWILIPWSPMGAVYNHQLAFCCEALPLSHPNMTPKLFMICRRTCNHSSLWSLSEDGPPSSLAALCNSPLWLRQTPPVTIPFLPLTVFLELAYCFIFYTAHKCATCF